MAKPPRETPLVQMPIRVDPTLKARLEILAKQKGKSLNALVSELLDHAVAVRGV